MFIELSLLLIGVGAVTYGSLAGDWLANRRRRRLMARLQALLGPLHGQTADAAEKLLGPPGESAEAESGRSLWVWHAPSLPRTPRPDGLLIVTVTLAPDRRVERVTWRVR